MCIAGFLIFIAIITSGYNSYNNNKEDNYAAMR